MSPARRGIQPSLFDIIFVIWAVVVPVGFGYRLLNSDGDLPRHLRLGQLMLERHGLLPQDVFSFTKAGQPFLAFEYGSELIYAAIYRVAGLAGVAVFAGLILALTYTLLARFLIRRGGDPLLAYLVSMAAAVLGAGHWLARPHLFTLLGTVILLELLYAPGRRTLRWYALLFVVWANLHGGFSFGCVLIALFAVGEAVEGRYDRARQHAAALGLAMAASLVNPIRVQAARARLRLLRQHRDPAPDQRVPVARLPYRQRQDVPRGAPRPSSPRWRGAGGGRRCRRCSWSSSRSPLRCSRSATSSSSRSPPCRFWRCISIRSGGRSPSFAVPRRCSSRSTPAATPGVGAATVTALLVDPGARGRPGRGRDRREQPVRRARLSGARRERGQPSETPGSDLQPVHLGRLPDARVAGAARLHRRRDRPLRREAAGRVCPSLESRAGMAGRTPAVGHRAGARAAREPSGRRAHARCSTGARGTATRPP